MSKFFLLVDDDMDDADLFAEALRGVAPPVDFLHLESGSLLLEYLEKDTSRLPDLLFLDINMPVLTGWQCLTLLRKQARTERLPVVVYSTSSYERDRNIAYELGADGFITKPSDFRTLKLIVSELASCSGESLPRVLREIGLRAA